MRICSPTATARVKPIAAVAAAGRPCAPVTIISYSPVFTGLVSGRPNGDDEEQDAARSSALFQQDSPCTFPNASACSVSDMAKAKKLVRQKMFPATVSRRSCHAYLRELLIWPCSTLWPDGAHNLLQSRRKMDTGNNTCLNHDNRPFTVYRALLARTRRYGGRHFHNIDLTGALL